MAKVRSLYTSCLLIVIAAQNVFAGVTLTVPNGELAGKSLHKEMIWLERQRENDTLTEIEKIRLAELYFLTSRCKDITLLGQGVPVEIACACGFDCPAEKQNLALNKFRELMAAKADFNSPAFKTAFSNVLQSPEASYYAIKLLQKEKTPAAHRLRSQLEKSLESLERH